MSLRTADRTTSNSCFTLARICFAHVAACHLGVCKERTIMRQIDWAGYDFKSTLCTR